jgi:hypothetical protein
MVIASHGCVDVWHRLCPRPDRSNSKWH